MADEPDVDIKFGAATEGIEEGAERSKEAIDSLKEHVEALKESGEQLHEIFETVLEAAGIEIGLDALKEFIESNAELGERLEGTAAMLGITGEQASELAGMAKLTGTDFDGLVHTMERFQVGLDTADSKTSRVGEALRVLGLSAREFIGVPVNQQLALMAEAFSKFADGSGKTAAAMALLGRSGAEMLPYLDRGKEGIEELQQVLQRTGAIMSNEMVGSFAKVNEHINEMKLAWQGLSNEIFDVVKGPIDAAIVGFTHLVESLRPDQIRGAMLSATQSVGAFSITAAAEFENVRANIKTMAIEFDSAMKVVAEAARLARAPIDALTGGVRELIAFMTVASNVAPMLAKAMHDVGGSAAPVAGSGPYGGVGPAPSTPDDPRLQAALNVKAETEAIAGYTKTVMDLFGKDPRTVRRGEGEGGPAESGKPAVPQMQLGGGADKDTAAKDAEQQFSEEAQAANAAEASIEADLESRLKLHQITMAQWLQQSNVALDAEALAVINAADKATAGTALNSEQKKAIWDKEEKDLAAIALKEQKDQEKAAEETMKSWTTAADKVASVMNSQVDSLLKGTETFATAFKNMFVSAVEDIIKELIKLGVEMLFIKTIMPAIGGGGGGPLGTLFHAIGIPGFAEGTDYVPQTGVALVHQGERITRASDNPYNPANGAVRPRGGDTHNYHIHSNSADGREVAKQVARQWDRNQTSRPKY